MIPKVSVHDNRVRVTLALPALESPIEHSLVETVQQVVEKVADGL